jgi:hypothetical protein
MTFEACAPLSLFAIFPRVCARGGSIIWNTLKCRREKQTPIQVVAPLLLLAGAHAIFISFFSGPRRRLLGQQRDCNNNAC